MQSQEITIEELQKWLMTGKISTQQFVQVLIDNIGKEKIYSIMKETMGECYAKDFLSKKIGKELEEIANKKDVPPL